jgi:AbrB family looped-hinge helix DNA binding protein
METATLTKITRNGQITLPAPARRALRVQEGDYVEVRVTEDSIVLTPKKLVDQSQAYFWSAEWQAAEREASDDIAAGRVHQAQDVDDLIAKLDKARKRKR